MDYLIYTKHILAKRSICTISITRLRNFCVQVLPSLILHSGRAQEGTKFVLRKEEGGGGVNDGQKKGNGD